MVEALGRPPRQPRRMADQSSMCRMLHRASISTFYPCLSLARKRLIVTGVIPKKDAISEWVKMAS